MRVPGMRVVKTALAVFLCFLISHVRGMFLSEDPWVLYSIIAAVQSMQRDRETSWSVGMTRVAGTLVGGLAGMLVIAVTHDLVLPDLALYAIFSALTIPLITVTVSLKVPDSAYMCCVTFFSIVLFSRMDVSPYWFAVNRIVDTLVGVLVAVGVNVWFDAAYWKRIIWAREKGSL